MEPEGSLPHSQAPAIYIFIYLNARFSIYGFRKNSSDFSVLSGPPFCVHIQNNTTCIAADIARIKLIQLFDSCMPCESPQNAVHVSQTQKLDLRILYVGYASRGHVSGDDWLIGPFVSSSATDGRTVHPRADLINKWLSSAARPLIISATGWSLGFLTMHTRPTMTS
jgi:hypothetical protein